MPHVRNSSSTNNANRDLFVCFASRLSSSSSSMKIAKSILSPGRAARDGQASLSNSLSRRLKANGSVKGGQASPMFPSVGRKKGCNFENPEPSSPKVTCIGQVRVKTKKKVNQTRSLSRRRSGEVSFRKVEQAHDFVSFSEDKFSGRSSGRYGAANSSRHVQECLPERNQRWVHFPVTICEALRTIGAEFSCLFPCRSPCFSMNEREKEDKSHVAVRDEENSQNQSSCGAVFARWFVSLQDCEGRQAKQIELVVGGDEERTEVMERTSMRRSSRKHVFEDIEFNEESIQLKAHGEEEEKGRVSICIPPKNALLLMRCRSDPMKMADLTNRFWESPAPQDDGEKEEDDEEITRKDVKERVFLQEFPYIAKESKQREDEEDVQSHYLVSSEDNKGFETLHTDRNLDMEMLESEGGTSGEKLHCKEESDQFQLDQARAAILPPFEVDAGQEMGENRESEAIEANGEDESCSPSRHSSSWKKLDDLLEKSEAENEKSEPDASRMAQLEDLQENEAETEDSSVDEEIQDPVLENDEEKQIATQVESQEEDGENANMDEENDRQESAFCKREEELSHKAQESDEESFTETNNIDKESSTTSSPEQVLPDCLLLMMCEPKLSMDMSKETWVCGTDFIRWLPERPVKKVNDEPKKRNSTDSKPLQPAQDSKTQKKRREKQQMMQPPRSSCSLPAAAASMATMIEQKLVNAVGYEPFVLTRCKSEPMRTASAKLIPEACCWKNRKLEPHRLEAFGVGAAGLGF